MQCPRQPPRPPITRLGAPLRRPPPPGPPAGMAPPGMWVKRAYVVPWCAPALTPDVAPAGLRPLRWEEHRLECRRRLLEEERRLPVRPPHTALCQATAWLTRCCLAGCTLTFRHGPSARDASSRDASARDASARDAPARDAPARDAADVTNACIQLFETTERGRGAVSVLITKTIHWLETQARSRVSVHTRFIQGKRPPSVVRGAGVQPKVFSPLYVTYRKPSSSLWSS